MQTNLSSKESIIKAAVKSIVSLSEFLFQKTQNMRSHLLNNTAHMKETAYTDHLAKAEYSSEHADYNT